MHLEFEGLDDSSEKCQQDTQQLGAEHFGTSAVE